MPATTITNVDTFFVARLYGTSSDIVLGAKGGGSAAHVGIQMDPLAAELVGLNKLDTAMAHQNAQPTEAECRNFLLGLIAQLPQPGTWSLAASSDLTGVHYYRPTGWVSGQGFAYGFPVTRNGSTLKRSVLVDGQALTVDFIAVVQPHV